MSFIGGVRDRGVSGREDDFGGVDAAARCAAAACALAWSAWSAAGFMPWALFIMVRMNLGRGDSELSPSGCSRLIGLAPPFFRRAS